MNADAGRDHWGHTFSVLFGGGGYRMGQVIGRSSPRGESVVDRPISPQDVAATVYHHLGIDAGQVSFPDHQGRGLCLGDSRGPDGGDDGGRRRRRADRGLGGNARGDVCGGPVRGAGGVGLERLAVDAVG